MVIERYNNDPTVGLAHTVSRDFQMSAGVAVVFRKKFGRPQMSDLIFQNLAYQQVNEGLSVYSLVTKEMYYGKPTNEEYDTAFQQLKIDFQTRGLKVLICSAMGCVRDLIQPQHFVDRISEFQKATGATVYIVSYNQEAKRKLWRGMSHEEFVKTLRQLIADRMEREQSSAPEENKAEDRSATPDINSAQASGSSNEFTPPALVPECSLVSECFLVSECSQAIGAFLSEKSQSSVGSAEGDCKVNGSLKEQDVIDVTGLSYGFSRYKLPTQIKVGVNSDFQNFLFPQAFTAQRYTAEWYKEGTEHLFLPVTILTPKNLTLVHCVNN
ncbi:ADP-ribose glycohydrolase oard1 [Homalodisca vitripennis]|nr:ADP-ribose glycohydrolase oard1 [Homalodisca vitripennis]